jgi:hypothetical protein
MAPQVALVYAYLRNHLKGFMKCAVVIYMLVISFTCYVSAFRSFFVFPLFLADAFRSFLFVFSPWAYTHVCMYCIVVGVLSVARNAFVTRDPRTPRPQLCPPLHAPCPVQGLLQVGYDQLYPQVKHWKSSPKTLHHNTQVIHCCLKDWGKSTVQLGVLSEWKAVAQQLNLKGSVEGGCLWMDSFNVPLEGQGCTSQGPQVVLQAQWSRPEIQCDVTHHLLTPHMCHPRVRHTLSKSCTRWCFFTWAMVTYTSLISTPQCHHMLPIHQQCGWCFSGQGQQHQP